MKKVILVLAMVLMASFAYAQDFSNFDRDYCLYDRGYEKCLEFTPSVFGPGAQWECDLVGYKDGELRGFVSLGNVKSEDGKSFVFIEIPEFIGVFEGGKLHLMQDLVVLEEK